MITFCCGMPGDGKSYFIMTQIEKELVDTERVIVTNVELFLENVASYLEKKYGQTFNLHSRYFFLDHEKTRKFWLYRGTHVLGEKDDGHGNVRCNFLTLQPDRPGVAYVIDELHEHFNARAWAKTGADALTYCSQHRKLGDSVYFISQRSKQVDSQMRSLAGTYVYCHNLAHRSMSFAGLTFGFGRKLIAKGYPEEKTGNREPVLMWRVETKVDPDAHGSWYDTAAGVGVKGSTADTKLANRSKGIPWQVILVGLLAVIAIGGLAPKYLFHGALKATGGELADQFYGKGEDPSEAPTPSVVTAAPLQPAVATNSPPVDVDPEEVDLSQPRSFQVRRDGFVTVVTKDGKQLTSADGIRLLGRSGFEFRGRLYPLP